MRIVAKNWENNSNKIKELENRIIAKIWSIIITNLLLSYVAYPTSSDSGEPFSQDSDSFVDLTD